MDWKIQLFKLNYNELEKKAVSDVLDSGWITMGENIINFEKKFGEMLGKDVLCSAVSSGTAAMHLAFLALDIGQNDEVVMPALTFVSDANCARLVNAKPVLADCSSEDNWNVSAESIKKVITDKTKAIVVVHYAGYPCDMRPIVDLCKEEGIYLIEDCAHAPGAFINDKSVGAWGDIGCFSFFTNKNLSVGEGGMTSTSNKNLGKRLASLRSHGMTSLTLDRHKGRSITYDVNEPGINYRMDEMRAALGLTQLEKLFEANTLRKNLTERYRSNFENTKIKIPFNKFLQSNSCVSAFHILPILLPIGVNRTSVIEHCRKRGIQTSIHYPAFWDFEAYKDRFDKNDTPEALNIIPRELTLPLYPSMTFEQVDEVTRTILEACE
ncbi:MAG: DegT/DnrJ/EryC1/StrS aminotransferase [Candidatus Marinimicrobia bacterium]|nr:DegT/DnrJ/EryC1/StrS aminotransferase [Candidatus Neomarinimicrobiota bacterium]